MGAKEIIKGGESDPRLFSYIQTQVVFNRRFNFPLLDADIPLCYGCAAVLQKVLHQRNIIAVVSVNLSSIVFAKTVRADAVDTQVVADDPQLLLYCPFRDGKKGISGGYTVVQTVTADVLIQSERNSKDTGFPGFLFDDGQAVSVSVPDNITEPEFQNVGNADA